MIDVSEEVKSAYLSDSIGKDVIVEIPDLDLEYTNKDFVLESMELKEALMSTDSIEFVGCIASYFKIEIFDAAEKLKGHYINVYIRDHKTNTKIDLFHGRIENAEKEANKNIKKIEAYDKFYELANVDIADWYNEHPETIQYDLLSDLLEYLGMSLQYSFLANGDMPALCGTKRQVAHLSALDLIKQLCQASGGFGKINRKGEFQVLYIGEETIPAYKPADDLFPSDDKFAVNRALSKKTPIPTIKFPYYTEVKYEDFFVVPIEQVIIRDDEESVETKYGEGTNKYIVQANLFVYDQTDEVLAEMVKNIYLKVNGISYVPFTSSNNGLPFLECGDIVKYDELTDFKTQTFEEKEFFVFSRVLKGIHALKDSYEAEGVEYQNIFITDLQAQIDSLKSKANSDFDRSEDEFVKLKRRVSKLESMILNESLIMGLVEKYE